MADARLGGAMRHIRGLAMAKAATRVTATCCSGSWAGRTGRRSP